MLHEYGDTLLQRTTQLEHSFLETGRSVFIQATLVYYRLEYRWQLASTHPFVANFF